MATRKRRAITTKAKSGGTKQAVMRRTKKKIPGTLPKLIPYSDGEMLTPLLMKPIQQKYRHGTYAHVSDIIGQCLRRVAVSDKYNLPIPTESIWPAMRLTFNQGHAIAGTMVEDAIRQAPDLVYARWSCHCGSVDATGTYQDVAGTLECETCCEVNTKHNELTFFDEEHAIVGNCDLALMVDGALYLNEIKSIKGAAWKELESPKPEHTLQALFYWWLARRNNLQLHDKVTIIYASKEYVFGSPYKEFTIQPSKVLHRIDEYLEDAKALKEYGDTKKLPIKVECASIDCTMAKNCHVAGPCFDEWALEKA